LSEDYRDMIYADTASEIEKRRKAFLRKWHLKCRAVTDSLEEAGNRLFTFKRLDPSQWKSARTTNAIERLNEEFRRRIKTQTVLPCAETVPMLLWALMASSQIQMRKVDGWETLAQPIAPIRPKSRCSENATRFETRPRQQGDDGDQVSVTRAAVLDGRLSVSQFAA
jgi:transposase-like protein